MAAKNNIQDDVFGKITYKNGVWVSEKKFRLEKYCRM